MKTMNILSLSPINIMDEYSSLPTKIGEPAFELIENTTGWGDFTYLSSGDNYNNVKSEYEYHNLPNVAISVPVHYEWKRLHDEW